MLISIAPVGLQGLPREIFYFNVDIWRSSQLLQADDAPCHGDGYNYLRL